MGDNVFPYPGGKSRYAEWIIDHLAEHECFVEVFGGSASILVNKPRSDVEIYNDLNDDLVHFFDVLRSNCDELVEWLRYVPYSRSLHHRWRDDYYSGFRPDDDIEKAGRFFYLRHTQFGGRIRAKSPFTTTTKKAAYVSKSLVSGRNRLKQFSKRFEGVIIECLDWSELVDRYDGDSTLFYFDPPYIEASEEYYPVAGDFDHSSFTNRLNDIDARWVCSYDKIPNGLNHHHTVFRDTRYTIGSSKSSAKRRQDEKLIMNYDPVEMSSFSPGNQKITDFEATASTDGGSE